jgi:ferredoxin/flavodoxin
MDKKGVIYYFTGTGNSLYTAKKIGAALNLQILPAESSLTAQNTQGCEVVGFVFPVYCMTVPPIIAKLIEQTSIAGNPYLFAVATCNAVPGNTLYDIRSLLEKKGKKLNAGFNLVMPGNSMTLVDLTQPEAERDARLENAEMEIEKITASICRHEDNSGLISRRTKDRIVGSIMFSVSSRIFGHSRLFTCTDACTKCGLCARICPSGNITVGSEITRGQNCLWCFGCFHLCPHKAIETGRPSRINKLRYRHPGVSLKELCRR